MRAEEPPCKDSQPMGVCRLVAAQISVRSQITQVVQGVIMPQDMMPESGRRLPSVCHITTVHLPFDERIFYKECGSLRDAGYDVHLVACHEKDEVRNGVEIHALPFPSGRLKRVLVWPFLALKAVRSIRPKPAICHFHDPELLGVGVILRLFGYKVIFDAHENVPAQIQSKEYLPRWFRLIASPLYRIFEWLCVRRMAIIEASMIEDKNRQPKQSIRNLPMIAGQEMRLRQLADFQAKPRLIYTGGVTVDRGAMYMLDLAEGLHDRAKPFEMQIVGSVFPSSLEAEMSEFISRHELADCVHMVGQVPFHESLRLVSEATIGLSLLRPTPNYLYALPIKILEYMTYGLAVICSQLPCSQLYMEHCDAGILVGPGQTQATLEAVCELLDDPETMLRYSRNGQKAIAAGLNWESEAELLTRFYRRVLGEPIGPDPCFYHQPRNAKKSN